MNIDIHAAGTWMKMMRYASPCCASVGATAKPSQSATTAQSAAAMANYGIRRPASGKNDAGDAKRNQLTEALVIIQT